MKLSIMFINIDPDAWFLCAEYPTVFVQWFPSETLRLNLPCSMNRKCLGGANMAPRIPRHAPGRDEYAR